MEDSFFDDDDGLDDIYLKALDNIETGLNDVIPIDDDLIEIIDDKENQFAANQGPSGSSKLRNSFQAFPQKNSGNCAAKNNQRQANLFDMFGLQKNDTTTATKPLTLHKTKSNSVTQSQKPNQPSTAVFDKQLGFTVGDEEPDVQHEMDLEAFKTWIFPINYMQRDYQFNIIQRALYMNTLVALPTGLGKTFIAAVVMFNYYRWFPKGKIIFMAPTKPLVNQQIDACYNITGLPKDATHELTGATAPEQRQVYWNTKRVGFLLMSSDEIANC